MKKTIILIILMLIIISGSSGFALETGDRAPDFHADSTKGTISLSDYLGKKNVVLAFYFADFTPV